MMKWLGFAIFLMAVATFLPAQQPPPPEPPGTHDQNFYDPEHRGVVKEPEEVVVQEGELKMSRRGDASEGIFVTSSGKVVFQSRAAADGKRIKVQVETNRLVLTADVDLAKQFVSFAGKPKDRTAAEMSLPDRSSVLSVLRAVEKQMKAKEETLKLSDEMLLRTLGVWSEWPEKVPLEQRISVEQQTPNQTQSQVSAHSAQLDDPPGLKPLCEEAKCKTSSGMSYSGSCLEPQFYDYAKHDCNHGDFDKPENQQRVLLGDHSTCNGKGEELYWDGSQWLCGEPDHWQRPFVQGDCFGRCGPSCGTLGVYSEDCLNHDGCVRNGHAIASPYCDDQFVACIDDEIFGPNCYTASP
jgi:hypothetical protein